MILLLVVKCKKDPDFEVFNEQLKYGSIEDSRDGHTYKTIRIGEQVWMAENLRYQMGDEEAEDMNCVYGRLYYSKSAIKACPESWHLPSMEEWEELFDFLGGKSVAGGKMKEVSYKHWMKPNTSADNASGFTAVPAGLYDYYDFYRRGESAYFWTSTKPEEMSCQEYYGIALSYKSSSVFTEDNWDGANFSVRCIKD